MTGVVTPHRAGLAGALLYLALAAAVIVYERRHSSFLPTMGTGMVTIPLSLFAEWLGVRLPLRNPAVAASLAVANSAFWYALIRGAAKKIGLE
jgi:hypothetical protein